MHKLYVNIFTGSSIVCIPDIYHPYVSSKPTALYARYMLDIIHILLQRLVACTYQQDLCGKQGGTILYGPPSLYWAPNSSEVRR